MTGPGLTFAQLRAANLARLPLFRNPKGEPAHAAPDGSDWSLGEWCNAVLGELGEAANLIKKVRRGDLTLDEARSALAREFADVATYLDLLAYQAGVDLGAATSEKWNEVSERVGVELRIEQFATAADVEAWLVEDVTFRLLAVSALLVAPVSEKNLEDARGAIAPLYGDALRIVRARRPALEYALAAVAKKGGRANA